MLRRQAHELLGMLCDMSSTYRGAHDRQSAILSLGQAISTIREMMTRRSASDEQTLAQLRYHEVRQPIETSDTDQTKEIKDTLDDLEAHPGWFLIAQSLKPNSMIHKGDIRESEYRCDRTLEQASDLMQAGTIDPEDCYIVLLKHRSGCPSFIGYLCRNLLRRPVCERQATNYGLATVAIVWNANMPSADEIPAGAIGTNMSATGTIREMKANGNRLPKHVCHLLRPSWS